MYIRLNRQPNAILLVEFHEKPNNKCEIDYSYYFLWVKPASIEDDPKDDTVQADIPKVYLKVSTINTSQAWHIYLLEPIYYTVKKVLENEKLAGNPKSR